MHAFVVDFAEERALKKAGASLFDAGGQTASASTAARVRQGVTDLRAQLGAQSMLLMQRDALVQLDAAALSADSALQRALGGGFEGSPNNNPGLSYAP